MVLESLAYCIKTDTSLYLLLYILLKINPGLQPDKKIIFSFFILCRIKFHQLHYRNLNAGFKELHMAF